MFALYTCIYLSLAIKILIIIICCLSNHLHIFKEKQISQSILSLLYVYFSGVSGAFLADIKPQTDGCNGLKYNITPDIIECIFKTYPAVKKKYIEHVPAKLTEAQFWTKFFQSHYFHR